MYGNREIKETISTKISCKNMGKNQQHDHFPYYTLYKLKIKSSGNCYTDHGIKTCTAAKANPVLTLPLELGLHLQVHSNE